jgi:hypothetical protein
VFLLLLVVLTSVPGSLLHESRPVGQPNAGLLSAGVSEITSPTPLQPPLYHVCKQDNINVRKCACGKDNNACLIAFRQAWQLTGMCGKATEGAEWKNPK